MNKRWLANLIWLSCLLNTAVAVAAEQCSAIFTNGAQTNSSADEIQLDRDATITGGSNILDTPKIDFGQGGQTCGGSTCLASGFPAANISMTVLTGSSNTNINVPKGSGQSLPAGDYRNIRVRNKASLTFTTNGGTYLINRLEVERNATLTLAPGDYWIAGDFLVDDNSQIALSSSGVVRIFAGDDVDIDQVDTNGFSSGQLLVYASDDLIIHAESTISGYFYAGDNLRLDRKGGDAPVITGAVSGDSVRLERDARINFPAESLDFGDFCSDTPPTPVAEWRLDEFGWTGGADEVADSSGNGLSGRAVAVGTLPATDSANPALAGNPGTCRYGVFDGPNTGYVQIDDPGAGSVLDIPDNLTVTSWIYPRSYPNSGLLTIASKDENYEYHLNTNGTINWWYSFGAFNSTAAAPLNQWTHIALVYRSGSQTIYINGVAAGTNNSTGNLITQNDPFFIGTDLNFDSRTFDGFIDEVRIYNQALTASQVQSTMNATHPCAVGGPDHYSVGPASGVACAEVDITIAAHDNSHGLTDALQATVTLTTSSGLGTWSGPGVTDATSGDGQASMTFAPGEQSQAVQLSYPTITNGNSDIFTITVDDGSITNTGSASDNPNITVALAGFRFIEDDGGTISAAVPNQVAARTSPEQLFLQAIRTDVDTGACVSVYPDGATISLEMAAEYRNPLTGAGSQMLVGNNNISTAIASNDDNGGASTTSFSTINLLFGADSKAPITLTYQDVGLMQLHARDTVTLPGGVSTTLTGASNDFVVKPYTFVATLIENSGGSANPATTSAGDGFVPAGTSFHVVVQAHNLQGDITPNYGNEISPENVALTFDSLIYPSGAGASNGIFNGGGFTATSTAGEFESYAVNWNEVGTITAVPDVGDGSYLGSGGAFVTTNTDNIGRFYPADFKLSGISTGYACGSFAYLSEPGLAVRYTLTARNASGATVVNYDTPDLNFPVATTGYHAENGNNGNDLASRVNVTTDEWDDGVYVVNTNNASFDRLAIIDGPFSNLQLSLGVTDALDGVNIANSDLDQDPATTGNCTALSNCSTAALGGPLSLHFGRARIDSTHGPESTALPVIFNTEYWNGSQFVTSTGDNCTEIPLSQIHFDGNSIDVSANRTVALKGGSTNGSLNISGANVPANGGSFGLSFSAPLPGMGSFPVDVTLIGLTWLLYDWDQNGTHDNDPPQATISFGSYRGHDRIIYWRERFD